MGLSKNKIIKNFKDDYEIRKITSKKLNIKYQTLKLIKKRSSSFKFQSILFEKKTDKKSIKNNKSENNSLNTFKNKKMGIKSLSYEKLEKIIEPSKDTNQLEKYNKINNFTNKINSEINISLNNNTNEKENNSKEIDENNSDESTNDIENQTEEINSSSTSNKDLLIINENIKSLFLNSNIVNDEKILNSLNQESTLSTIDYELNFYRNGNDIRRSYIQKLVSKELFLPNNKPKTHNSLIIFDWDDTLLPTSFLSPGGVFNENILSNENIHKKIEKLENSVLTLLNMAISKGDVYIITNAGSGWVEYSAKKIYPSVVNILNKIKIISARGEWERDFPGDIKSWKIQAFLSLTNKLDVKLVTNIICLGDSMFEIEAGRILWRKFSEAFIKTIKFKERPKPEELNKQLAVVISQFNFINSAVKNMTIRVEKKKL